MRRSSARSVAVSIAATIVGLAQDALKRGDRDPEDQHVRSGRIALSELGPRKGKLIAYLFDFGDEWRLLLKVVDRRQAGEESYPMLVDAIGTPPAQYAQLDEDEEAAET